MVDEYLNAGFTYFDTAHGYLQGKSEQVLKTCLTSRYPRERFVLTDKLTNFFFQSEADIRPFFQSQLEACGVDYFDFYLMHAQNEEKFAYFKTHRAYETAFALKAEGKIRHVGRRIKPKPKLRSNPSILTCPFRVKQTKPRPGIRRSDVYMGLL